MSLEGREDDGSRKFSEVLANAKPSDTREGFVKWRVFDLFSGIGGFSLGLERAGMKAVAFCEIDPFCRRVLAKHWPGVPIYDDVRTLTAERLRADGIVADVICGGFPCQDISAAGLGAGIDGARSGLWREYSRLIGELRPHYVIVENVAALLGRGLDRVLGDLAALGFDAEWHCIPASAVGAPHRRDRVWIVAYPARRGDGLNGKWEAREGQSPSASEALADADRPRLSLWLASALGAPEGNAQPERQDCAGREWWAVEPAMGRVAHGIPSRVDRLKSLGNAVVPQIPEIIGRAMMKPRDEAEDRRRT